MVVVVASGMRAPRLRGDYAADRPEPVPPGERREWGSVCGRRVRLKRGATFAASGAGEGVDAFADFGEEEGLHEGGLVGVDESAGAEGGVADLDFAGAGEFGEARAQALALKCSLECRGAAGGESECGLGGKLAAEGGGGARGDDEGDGDY